MRKIANKKFEKEWRKEQKRLEKIRSECYKAIYGYDPFRTKPKRKAFPKRVKLQVLINQGFKCRSCISFYPKLQFDHINDDRSNNSIFNCQALCPNCHAKKTRGNKNCWC